MSCVVQVSEQPLRVTVNPVTNLVTVQSPGPQGPPGTGGGASAAADVTYDNTASGLAADDVQAAIDEIAAAPGGAAVDVSYDNTASGLTSTDVQGAIDELAATPGGSGTPGGADTQIQYNDGGAFGGDAGLTFNETTKAVTITGATVAADTPVLNLYQTWNNGAVSFNAVHAHITKTAGQVSCPVRLDVNGVTQFASLDDGTVYVLAGVYAPNWLILAGSGRGDGLGGIALRSGELNLSSGGQIGWSTTSYALENSSRGMLGVPYVAGSLEFRCPTAAALFRVYNTFTDSTNWERAVFGWAGNVCYLATENTGTGIKRPLIVITDGMVVANLPTPSAIYVGARAFVTNATATTFLSVVAGGGANKVPVVCDGTAWLIG